MMNNRLLVILVCYLLFDMVIVRSIQQRGLRTQVPYQRVIQQARSE